MRQVVITITEAKLTHSDNGAEFIEFSGESEEGKKYLLLDYTDVVNAFFLSYKFELTFDD